MFDGPTITILEIATGVYPEILPLNPRFRDVPMLLARLRIRWRDGRPEAGLRAIQHELLRVSPSFRQHECRGPAHYHVRRGLGRHGHGHGPGHGRGAAREPEIEAGLALAHLIEHIIIDAVAFVASESRLSGITGARRGASDRFDVFVECPDAAIAGFATRLGVGWASRILREGGLGDDATLELQLARYVRQKANGRVRPEEAARALQQSPQRIAATLSRLRGYGLPASG